MSPVPSGRLLLGALAVGCVAVAFWLWAESHRVLGFRALPEDAFYSAWSTGPRFALSMLLGGGGLFLLGMAGRFWSMSRAALDRVRFLRQRPLCFFRSFRDDGSRLQAQRDPIKRWISRLTLTENMLGHTLSSALNRYGPLLAIGRPGERLPPSGFVRLYPEDWEDTARVLIRHSQVVLLVVDTSDGVDKEFDFIIQLGALHKTLICLPDFEAHLVQERWGRLRERLAACEPSVELGAFAPAVRFLHVPPFGRSATHGIIDERLVPAKAYGQTLRRFMAPRVVGNPVVLILDVHGPYSNIEEHATTEAMRGIAREVELYAPLTVLCKRGTWRGDAGEVTDLEAWEPADLERLLTDVAGWVFALASDPAELLEEHPRLLEAPVVRRLHVLRCPCRLAGSHRKLQDLLYVRRSLPSSAVEDRVAWAFPSEGTIANYPDVPLDDVEGTYRRVVYNALQRWIPTADIVDAIWPRDRREMSRSARALQREGRHDDAAACYAALADLTGDASFHLQAIEALKNANGLRALLERYPRGTLPGMEWELCKLRTDALGGLREFAAAFDELQSAHPQDPVVEQLRRITGGGYLIAAHRFEDGLRELDTVDAQFQGLPAVELQRGFGLIGLGEDVGAGEQLVAGAFRNAPEMLLNRHNLMLLLTLLGEDKARSIARQAPLPQDARSEFDEFVRQELLFLEHA